jgi:proton-dependent oligopeptide transporter, POT family
MMSTGYKQPKGFSIFFLTEMWERYGFYVVQTVLVFYLLKELHLSDKENYIIIGSFTALAYINSLFGGMIADRLIGSANAVILGAIALMVGYFLLSIAIDIKSLTLSLSFIAVGTGLLKPNLTSLLSILYPDNDEQFKESGYTLYYVGLYIGALGGSLLGGYIQKYMGWSTTFLSAAIAMSIGLIIFIIGKTKYKLVDPRKTRVRKRDALLAIISILVMFIVSCAAIHSEFMSKWIMIVVGVFCIGLILLCIYIHNGNQRQKLIAFSGLILLLVCYWAIFFQQFFTISLAIERTAFLPFPSSSMPAVETLGVVLFGPIINFIWFYYKRNKGSDISISTKFSLSFLFNGACFLILAGGLWFASLQHTYFNVWFIVPAYLLLAIGELCIAPTSLAMVTTLVPKKYTSMMMGISLLSIGFGSKLTGVLATVAVVGGKMHGLAETQTIYMNAFFIYFLISTATLIASLILGRYIKKLIDIKE